MQTGKGTLSPPTTTQRAGEDRHSTGFASAAAICAERAACRLRLRLRRYGTRSRRPQPSRQTRRRLPRLPPEVRLPRRLRQVRSPRAAPAPQQASAAVGTGSPIGQLTTGDSALGERTKHETADLIGETQQGLNGIKRSLSYGRESHGGANTQLSSSRPNRHWKTGMPTARILLATKAKLLLDELTKPYTDCSHYPERYCDKNPQVAKVTTSPSVRPNSAWSEARRRILSCPYEPG